jgi:tetratricopeptide (TPR) repeat protein
MKISILMVLITLVTVAYSDYNESSKEFESSSQQRTLFEDNDLDGIDIHKKIASQVRDHKNHEKTLEHFEKSLKILISTHKNDENSSNFATSLKKLGLLYKDLNEYELAIMYFNKLLTILRNINKNDDHVDIVSTLNTLGLLYLHLIRPIGFFVHLSTFQI